MNSTRRILPIALVAALLGGSVGAFVMRSPKSADASNNPTTTAPAQTDSATANQAIPVNETGVTLTSEQAAFRDGFEEGFLAAQNGVSSTAAYRSADQTVASTATRTRRTGSSSSRSYRSYDNSTYSQPAKRSFWQKHRDKLTVAMGTGGGALIGGLVGGKKGALIGGLAGAGGSALYTYKLRNRTPKY